MTVRDIVTLIGTRDVPVHFHRNENNPLFSTRILTREESRELRGVDGEDRPLGVHLLDQTVEHTYELLYSRGKDNIEVIEQLIRSSMDIDADIDMKYAVILFMVLHEFGHWKHFVESHLSRIEYWKQFGTPEDCFHREFGSSLRHSSNRANTIREYAAAYRQLPMEAAADKYAIKEMAAYI